MAVILKLLFYTRLFFYSDIQNQPLILNVSSSKNTSFSLIIIMDLFINCAIFFHYKCHIQISSALFMVQYAQHKEATNKNMRRNNIII